METVDTITRVDMTSIELVVGARLDIRHARWLRGAIAKEVDRTEFHQHCGTALVYRHPLIRYDTSTGNAALRGLKQGAMLLKAYTPPDSIRLGSEEFRVFEQDSSCERCEVGLISGSISYRFASPYLALNQVNLRRWQRSDPDEQREIINRIICGNILSFCKSIGHHVQGRLVVQSYLRPSATFTLKPGIRLLGFTGSFSANFLIPERWGIGKSSSRGFGTLAGEGA